MFGDLCQWPEFEANGCCCTTEALVLRNVGGHVGPALDDIITLDGALGLNEIMVIQHTGMCHSSLH